MLYRQHRFTINSLLFKTGFFFFNNQLKISVEKIVGAFSGSRNVGIFIEHEASLSFSQEPITGSYFERLECNARSSYFSVL
jgi:hypothetical protein